MTDFLLVQVPTQTGRTEFEHGSRRFAATGNGQSRFVVKQVIEEPGKAGHRQVQMLTNLASQGRSLLDEVPPMSDPQL